MPNDVTPDETSRSAKGGLLRTLACRSFELATLAVGITTIGTIGAGSAWPLELCSHFRVQYSVVLVLAALLFLLWRRWRWCATALVLLCINAWSIAPFLLSDQATVDHELDPGAPSLTLASINVYSGNPTPDRVIEYIRATLPDVVVLLEVTPAWEQRMEAISNSHPWSAVHSSADNFGIAIYSREPLRDVDVLLLSEQNRAISARIEADRESIHLVAAHPFPPVGSSGSRLRDRQLRRLAEHAATLQGRVIVAGDLNITPFSPVFDDFLAAAKLRDPRRGHGLLPTWPSRRFPLWIPIDHCLVSDGIAARLAVGPHVGSDHRPLRAELQLR